MFPEQLKSDLVHEKQNDEGEVEFDSLLTDLEGSLSSSPAYFEDEEKSRSVNHKLRQSWD